LSTLHEELVARHALTTCKLCMYLRTLSAQEHDEWQVELRWPNEVVSNTSVVRALERRGLHLDEASVRRHRSNHVSR